MHQSLVSLFVWIRVCTMVWKSVFIYSCSQIKRQTWPRVKLVNLLGVSVRQGRFIIKSGLSSSLRVLDLSPKKVGCCVFRPTFGCCAHPKAGLTTFFSFFNLFCSFQTFVSDFTPEINKKRLKKKKKSTKTRLF